MSEGNYCMVEFALAQIGETRSSILFMCLLEVVRTPQSSKKYVFHIKIADDVSKPQRAYVDSTGEVEYYFGNIKLQFSFLKWDYV